jgi:steroid delta-isomerase-like uncharacterized protein
VSATAADTATGTIEELAHLYGEAWNARDLEAILAFHTEDTVFQLHAEGEPVEGREAVREAFAAFLAQWPDINFEPMRLHMGDRHWVQESRVTATLAQTLEIDGVRAEPTGARVSFDAVDTFEVVDGRVARKDTYIDALKVQKDMGLAP